MPLSQLLRLIWARRHIMLLIAALVSSVVLAVNLLLPRTYVSTTSVVVNSKNVDPISGQTMPLQSAQIATQLDVIGSRNVALKVVDALKLTHEPRMWPDATDAVHTPGREALAGQLLKNLRVLPARDSTVITIEFAHRDRQLSAAIANGFADAYLQTNLELRLDPAKRQSTWFDEQLRDLRKTLEVARQYLSDYQRTHGIVGTDERLDVERARLDEISRQLAEAQRDASVAESRAQQMTHALKSNQLEELPEIMGNTLLQSLKSDLVRAEAKLADLGQRYDTNYPPYRSAQAEVNSLSGKLRAEIEKARGSIDQSLQIATEQARQIQQSFDAQKARVLQLQRERDEAAVLNREAENAQRAYDSALQRAGQVRMESQLDLANVAVLDRAAVPRSPARPRVPLNVALGLALGCMLGAAVALLLELTDRRLRSRSDLIGALGLPVLAEVPTAR